MSLDIFVVVIYALGMLVLGWYGMRKAKTHEDYLVAGPNLGPSLYIGLEKSRTPMQASQAKLQLASISERPIQKMSMRLFRRN